MESLGKISDEALYAIGQNNLNYEKYDEQVIYDKINSKIDKQQEKIDNA